MLVAILTITLVAAGMALLVQHKIIIELEKQVEGYKLWMDPIVVEELDDEP